ncbi:MAG: glycyl-radical enzyme activating protein [Candidatus Bathyarchaeota archaeon]|nr:glycyl-radical enzyme activating protein [Candidatus Bathyarchaeota archaeon]
MDSLQSVTGLLLDIDRFAAHDGPGIRTIVFLKGCPLRCLWCHSPESQASHPQILFQPERCTTCGHCIPACPNDALRNNPNTSLDVPQLSYQDCSACGQCVELCYSNALRIAGRPVTATSLVNEVRKDIPFFERSGGGVTVSGGEPLMQPHLTYHFLAACKQQGIHTALETSGYAPWNQLLRIAKTTDLVLFDVKMLDPDLHRTYTGVTNQLILHNLQQLVPQTSIQVRVPCIPGINDRETQIHELAIYLSRIGIAHIALLPYNAAANAKYQWIGRPYPFSQKQTQSEDYMKYLARLCTTEGLHVQIGG